MSTPLSFEFYGSDPNNVSYDSIQTAEVSKGDPAASPPELPALVVGRASFFLALADEAESAINEVLTQDTSDGTLSLGSLLRDSTTGLELQLPVAYVEVTRYAEDPVNPGTYVATTAEEPVFTAPGLAGTWSEPKLRDFLSNVAAVQIGLAEQAAFPPNQAPPTP